MWITDPHMTSTKTMIISIHVHLWPTSGSQSWRENSHVCERTELDSPLRNIAFSFWKPSCLLVSHPHLLCTSRDGHINQTCDHIPSPLHQILCSGYQKSEENSLWVILVSKIHACKTHEEKRVRKYYLNTRMFGLPHQEKPTKKTSSSCNVCRYISSVYIMKAALQAT